MIAQWRPVTICGAALCLVALGSGAATVAPVGGEAVTKVRVVGHPAGRHVWLGVFGEDGKASSWTRVTDGRFEVRLDARVSTLMAICKNRVPAVFALPVGPRPATVEMRLVRGLSLDGVVRSDEGRRLGGAAIRVLRSERGIEVPAEVSPRWEASATGAFSIFGLQPGLHDIEVTAAGHIPTTLRDVAVRDARDERGNHVEVEVPRAFTVRGRVLDEEGQPVFGAPVTAAMPSDESRTAVTDADGKYRVGPFRRGQAATVWAGSPALGTTKRHRVVAPRDDLGLVLRRRVVRGQVTDAMTGRPMERFRVRVLSQGKKRTHDIASEDGVFAVPVDVETYAIAVDAPGRFPWFSEFATGAVAAYDLGSINLDRARAITGRVFDARSGSPIAGATVGLEARSGEPLYLFLVTTRPERVKTDESGAFALHGLPDQSVNVSVDAAGYFRKTILVVRDGGFIEVDLAPGATVAGSLVLPDGTPVAGFVNIVSAEGDGRGMAVEDGAFQWDGLDDGEYEISATSDAGAVDNLTVMIEDGESVRDIRLVVAPLGTLNGQITGLFPAEEATVGVRDENGRLVISQSFGNGAYAMRGVPTGTAMITVHTTAGRSLALRLRLGDRDEARADLDFAARSRLRGVVTAGGRPLGVARLALTPEDRSLPSAVATTNELGQYAAEGLGEGPYRVRIHTGHVFDVDVGADTVFDMRLPDISLAGTVKAAATGELIAPAWMELVRESSWGSVVLEAHVASDGSFRFDGLVQGEYMLRVVAPQFESFSRKVWIAGAEFADIALVSTTSEEDRL